MYFLKHGVSLILTSRLALSSFALIFQFGETGRCIHPQFFVDHNEEKGSTATFELKNVRGDGDCIFLAVTRLGDVDEVRKRVSDIFREGTEILDVTPETKVSASALLQQAASEMNCTRREYLERLQTPGRYGGGPELAVLSHLLRCSIAVYEVADEDQIDCLQPNNTTIQPIACRGVFGRRSADIDDVTSRRNILIVNTTAPNEKHACILIPTQANVTSSQQ